jgi:hypothetical protein
LGSELSADRPNRVEGLSDELDLFRCHNGDRTVRSP